MPALAIFKSFTLRPRRKRSRVSVNSATFSKSSGSIKEKRHQNGRAASEPLPNGDHGRTDENGESHQESTQSVDAPSGPNVTSSPTSNGTPGPDLNGLANAAAIANSTPQLSKTEKILDVVEDGALSLSAHQNQEKILTNILTTTLEVTGGMDVISDKITSVVENITPLMNVLNELKTLHPFVGVVVMAFQVAWSLEMTRRQNNQKVLALHVEMKDMIGVFVRLRDIKNPEVPGSDGKKIEDRMRKLVDETATTINDCANACDTYTKKKLIVKVLSGSIWEMRLAEFAVHFTKLRSEFEFELSIHTAGGVDSANEKLVDMQARMNEMLEMLGKLVSPDEARMQKAIDDRGGRDAVLENEKLLKEVSKDQLAGADTEANGKPYTFADLKDDLKADIDELITKNMEGFERKIKLGQDKIKAELESAINKMEATVIAQMESGPHDRIIDPDISQLWKDMGWRGSIKSRLFVMTLRDYFHEKWAAKIQTASANGSGFWPGAKLDGWALVYLDIQWLQPVCESFDDNASGFITTNEVNAFTEARPDKPYKWSLLHWIAYWAVGWHQSISHYAAKIRQVFAKMFAILPNITDINLPHIHKYLDQVYQDVTTVEASVNPCFVNEALRAKFSDYTESEEMRLRKKLETIQYDIDHADTLLLINGGGRIGKYIHCVLYLLLEHHFKIFRLAQKKENIINPDELWDAAGSIHLVIKAYKERYELLLSVFRQQRLDPKQQFETFANGMFRYRHDPRSLWSPKIVNTQVHPNFVYDDSLEDPAVYGEVNKTLIHGLVEEGLDYAAYDPYPPKLEPFGQVDPLLEPILGTWNALQYRKALLTVPSSGMTTMSFLPVTGEGKRLHFKASARAPSGDFTVTGQCTPAEGADKIKIVFKREFKSHVPTQYWSGTFDPSTESISGTWGTDPKDHFGVFILKRTDPLDLRFRPAPAEFDKDQPKALWKYARLAMLSQIKRKSWKWSYFQDRRHGRKKFFELYIRNGHFGKPLDADEMLEKPSFTTYHANGATVKLAKLVIFASNARIKTPGVPSIYAARHHLHTHEVAKVRRVIHIRDFGRLYQDASKTLEFARTVFRPPKPLLPDSDSDFPSHVDSSPPDSPMDAGRCVESVNRTCTHCKNAVSIPCWCYINPDAGTFICDGCEGKGFSKTQDLVRCQRIDTEFNKALGLEERLSSLERRFVTTLQDLDSKVDVRFREMEALLRRLSGTEHAKETGEE
ncbi:hypothetical protein BU17DRAFT_102863 [Hysterangium stoloniferum]|nr:hypothetical protein BU17DRAFT_102863 [Hysterangium stoloniferum]